MRPRFLFSFSFFFRKVVCMQWHSAGRMVRIYFYAWLRGLHRRLGTGPRTERVLVLGATTRCGGGALTGASIGWQRGVGAGVMGYVLVVSGRTHTAPRPRKEGDPRDGGVGDWPLFALGSAPAREGLFTVQHNGTHTRTGLGYAMQNATERGSRKAPQSGPLRSCGAARVARGRTRVPHSHDPRMSLVLYVPGMSGTAHTQNTRARHT